MAFSKFYRRHNKLVSKFNVGLKPLLFQGLSESEFYGVFRLGKRELICLLLFTCNYVVSVSRGFLFLWVLGMDYVILLWHSLSLPYNYLVYKLWVGRTFSDLFRKSIIRYKHIGYNLNVMRKSVCLLIYLITVNSYASLFYYTPVGRASDSMVVPTF